MRNADMPAMPTRDAVEDCGPDGSQGPYMLPIDFGGLTKREYFAAMAMQGLLASFGQHDVTDAREIACDAATFADALLAEMEETS